MELLFLGILIGVVAEYVVARYGRKHKGNLILIEGDENDTYAFLELHEPIDKIKNKKSINLKIEKRTR